MLFNDVNGLQSLINNNRIRVERFGAPECNTDCGHRHECRICRGRCLWQQHQAEAGTGGLGGTEHAGNGFYRILVDTNGDGNYNDSMFEFFRLYGDSNGDGKVTSADGTVNEDLNGDGLVDATDRAVGEPRGCSNCTLTSFAELDD